ncbi:hypothetical protein CU044_2096 [Streptomyces sp. L-9-10]|nr:hypothetical protein CU044_2096 [Streptomyces sp. L-9-10]
MRRSMVSSQGSRSLSDPSGHRVRSDTWKLCPGRGEKADP